MGPIIGAAWKPGRQAGRRARVLVTLKSLVMWGVKVQQRFRQNPRFRAGQKRCRLTGTRQMRLQKERVVEIALRSCKRKQERWVRKDKGDAAKDRRRLTVLEKLPDCVDNNDDD